MSKSARITRLLGPLFKRHPDLALADGWLVLKPIHHVLRGIILDRTSISGVFYARWAMIHTFAIQQSVPLNWGDFVLKGGSGHPNFFELPEVEISRILCERIERETLPLLRSMKTLQDYVDFRMNREPGQRLPWWPIDHFWVELGVGNFDAARAVRDKNKERWFKDRPEWDDEDRAAFGRLRNLCALLDAGDYAEIARLMREWEAITARNLKIEAIWEPTLFPFELKDNPAHPPKKGNPQSP